MQVKFKIRLYNLKKSQGFTLIELLVVIGIIGLLASIILVSVSFVRQKARDTRRLSDISQISKALDMYYADCGYYPGYELDSYLQVVLGSDLTFPSCPYNAFWPVSSPLPTGTTVYLDRFPSPPTPPDGTCTEKQNYYSYTMSPKGSQYGVTFCLGSAAGGYSAGARILTNFGIK